MAWLGIDPGMEGAVALIQPDGTVKVWDTPTVSVVDPRNKTRAGKPKVRRIYDRAGMASIVSAANIMGEGGLHVVIEKVHAMPKQGVVSSFVFGAGYGIWLGIIAALMLPHTLVDPKRWTKLLLADITQGDASAVIRVCELYPAMNGQLRTPRGALELGRADAILLAHYARLQQDAARDLK